MRGKSLPDDPDSILEHPRELEPQVDPDDSKHTRERWRCRNRQPQATEEQADDDPDGEGFDLTDWHLR